MTTFDCPRCSKTFDSKGAWIYHLQHGRHGLALVSMIPTTIGPSQATTSGSSMSIPSTPPAGDIGPAIRCFKLETKVSFKVAYDLGRGYEAQPIRVTIPKDESYDQFLWRLHNVFYGDSFERSLRQWEYVLVNRRFEKGDSLPLTSSNTYYAMVSELLRQRSQWRHAVIRRSHSENPIIRAVAEGRYTPTLDLPILDAAVPDISLPDNTPVSDAFQLDDSKADNPRPNVPMDQATPELLNSTPPSRAWNVNSASATPLSRTPSPGLMSRPNTRELSTPVASTRDRRLLHLSSPLAPTARVRDPMQPYSPLISSPLAPTTSKGGRRSMQLSFPIAPVTASPRPSQVNPPLAPVISTQSPILLDSPPLAPAALLGSPSLQLGSPIRPPASAQAPPVILPIVSGPSSSQDHGSNEGLGALSSPAVIAPRPPAIPPITSVSSSSTPAPELFQRPLNPPPRSNSKSSSNIQAPPITPIPILRPRRPLSIISRRSLNHVTEYQVHWNSGRNSWEPHDSLYRKYPAFVQNYLERQRQESSPETQTQRRMRR